MSDHVGAWVLVATACLICAASIVQAIRSDKTRR